MSRPLDAVLTEHAIVPGFEVLIVVCDNAINTVFVRADHEG